MQSPVLATFELSIHLSVCLSVCLSVTRSHCVRTKHTRKSHGRKSDKQTRKQNLTRKSHSRSFKVMHFGITEKLTMDCVSLYNGLISKVSEVIASKNAENCRCRQRHCRLAPPPQGTESKGRMRLPISH